MACRACAEEARASGGVGSRVALDFEKLEMAGWTVEQREKSLVFFSPLPEKKRFKSSKDVADYLKSRGEFESFILCHCGTFAMSQSRSSESDEDYRPDTEEEALSSVFGDTPVQNDGLRNSPDVPSPKRLAMKCLAIILIRYRVSSIEGCFDRGFIRLKPKVSSIEAKVSIEEYKGMIKN